MDREKIIRIIDELIFEAQKAPTWKAENALRCLKKELLKEQEAVEPEKTCSSSGITWWNVCGNCKTAINPNDKYCHECGMAVKWK